ncbi:MAG: cupin domain-containing protein [Candidatus Rokubacteria bacterium]|nr:cupin domain-containing protein [Candidatus Rokubacteria bacterium]
MSFLEMRALMTLAVIAGALFSHTPVEAQTTTAPGAGRPTPIREVLASRGLSTVVDAPLYFRLLRVTLPAGQSTGYAGPHGFVYGLSGGLAVAGNGGPAALRGGEAVFVDAGRPVTLRAMEGESAVFLHFLLVRAAELNSSTEGPPAAVTELYRTAAPIPGLKPGPYEFSLTRVTFPPQFPINPPHRRSGAALYYIPSGTGAITTGGRTEPRPSGSIQYEPNDFVHQWANPGDTPLLLLQANISPEGTPVVIFER